MLKRLIPFLKAALSNLWEQRFQRALVDAQIQDSPVAYRKGYSKGYWDGMSDMAWATSQQEELHRSHGVTSGPVSGLPGAEA